MTTYSACSAAFFLRHLLVFKDNMFRSDSSSLILPVSKFRGLDWHVHCLCMRARPLDSLCRGTFKVLEIIWPMKTLILNVLLQISHNSVKCMIVPLNREEYAECWDISELEVFWVSYSSKSSVLFKTILSWSCSKPVGAKSLSGCIRVRSQTFLLFKITTTRLPCTTL